MKYIHVYYYVCISCMLCCCETAVEVDIPPNPTQLTANALFTPDSLWQVELSANRYILDNSRFAPVQDAVIQIIQAGRVIASLDYLKDDISSGNSIYQSASNQPTVGKQYTLNVKSPSHDELVATSEVPPTKTAVTRAILDTLDVRQDGQLNDNQLAYAVTVLLDDPPEENFYSLSLFIRWDGLGAIDIGGNPELKIEEEVSTVYLRSDNPIVDDPFDTYRKELIFKDVSFNGQQYELKAYMLFELNNDIFNRLFSEGFILDMNAYDREKNLVRQPGDTAGVHTLYAQLRTTTEEYYQYYFTRDLQASVESNPFAQPVQVFDNIEGGLGIFAGYSQAEKEVTIK